MIVALEAIESELLTLSLSKTNQCYAICIPASLSTENDFWNVFSICTLNG